jgi:hypothetical protein
LGAADDIVNEVDQRLEGRIQAMGSGDEAEEFLLSSRLKPAILQKSGKLGQIRFNLENAIRRLQEQSDNGRAKQKLLDIPDTANAEADHKVEDTRTIQIDAIGGTADVQSSSRIGRS